MAKYKVIDMRKIPSGEPGRVGRLDVVATVQDETGDVEVIVVPAEEFSEERLRQEIKKRFEEKAQWVGKEIEI